MNHATILRRSKTHRAAAARNAESLERAFCMRLTIRVPSEHVEVFDRSFRGSGTRLLWSQREAWTDNRLFDVEAPLNHRISRNSPLFTIVKEERVRRK